MCHGDQGLVFGVWCLVFGVGKKLYDSTETANVPDNFKKNVEQTARWPPALGVATRRLVGGTQPNGKTNGCTVTPATFMPPGAGAGA
jgi:hypothetical protein